MHVREFPTQDEAHRTLTEEDPSEMTPYVVTHPDGKIDFGVYVPKSHDAYSQDQLRKMLADTIAKVNTDLPPALRGLRNKIANVGASFRDKRPSELTRNQKKKLRQLGR